MEFVNNFFDIVTDDPSSLYVTDCTIVRELPNESFYGTYDEMVKYILPKGTQGVKIARFNSFKKDESEENISITGKIKISGKEYVFNQFFVVLHQRSSMLIKKDIMTVFKPQLLTDFDPCNEISFNPEQKEQKQQKQQKPAKKEEDQNKKREPIFGTYIPPKT